MRITTAYESLLQMSENLHKTAVAIDFHHKALCEAKMKLRQIVKQYRFFEEEDLAKLLHEAREIDLQELRATEPDYNA